MTTQDQKITKSVAWMISILLFTFIFAAASSSTTKPPSWSYSQLPVEYFLDIFYLDKNHDWLTGSANDRDVIYHTSNGGTDWRDISPLSVMLVFMPYSSAIPIRAVPWADKALIRLFSRPVMADNPGNNKPAPLPECFFRDVFFIDTTHGWAVGNNTSTFKMAVVRTTDGNTWTVGNHPVYSGELYSVHFTDVIHVAKVRRTLE